MSMLHWHLTHLPSPKHASNFANNYTAPDNNDPTLKSTECSSSAGATRKVVHDKRTKRIQQKKLQHPGIEAIAKKFSSFRKKSQMRFR